MVSIIPPNDPFATPLAQNIARAGQAFAQQHQQRQQGQALAQLLKSVDPERFGDLDPKAFGRLNPQVAGALAQQALKPKDSGATKTQRASAINKIADTQVKEILNNFRGPLGEIKLEGKKGQAAKKAIRKINESREKKLKAIFGDDLPGLDADELDIVGGYLSGDFDEIEELPAEVVDNEGGFFQGIFNFFKGSSNQKAAKKKLNPEDLNRIAKEVKKNNPSASPEELQRLAEKMAKDEGFEF